MIRFNFSKLRIFAAALITLLALYSCSSTKSNEEQDVVDLVVPTVDSANSRWFFFSSACRPFGMVNLSPDTQVGGAWGSGYRYNTDTVKGFSHIHAWQLAGVSVMPVVLTETEGRDIFDDYGSKFSHEQETVFPGYHSLELERYNIKAELTSSKRVGFHRYTFGEKERAALLFNLNGMLGPSVMKDGELKQVDAYTLEGKTVNSPTMRRPKDCSVFFHIELSKPIRTIVLDDETKNYLVNLDLSGGQDLLMKVAISYTSVGNAAENLKAEIPEWNFDQIVKESRSEWNGLLSRIEVQGGTVEQQKRFYTDLWHSLQGRRTISDVNGAYPDNTGKEFRIGQIPLDGNGRPLFNHYNSDAFWGAQWTINTLWGLVYPEMMSEFTQSLMQYYKDSGMVPRGPSGGNFTFVMTGASATPFIVSAIQKGIVKDSLDEIYQALKKDHMPGGIMEKAGYEHDTSLGGGLKYYIENGYVPYPIPEGEFGLHQEGASLTMEYAYQDWALAQLAHKLGYEGDCEYFMKRSKNYRNVYDSGSGWMRPKDVDGKWFVGFDPHQHEHGFNESNGAQSTWFVPHDLKGLAELMGGDEEASAKLNESFLLAEKQGFTIGTSHDVEHHPEYNRVPINYGNQPSIQTAFIFNYLGKPWLTQYWSRKVVETVYEGLSPERGYNGDEDQGLMGSLSVLMKLGLFSMDGGCLADPQLELGSPLFDKVVIHLNPAYYSGKTIEIETINNSPENCYIQSATFNGAELTDWRISQESLTGGGKIILEMGDEPNENWGIN
ncbi:GH92 family glycosyl hydrolase [Mangrovibacterium diazotrophicum]|uniref:Putative alpha-1,2-mannosidase n=1 Tax=Mangrovibacterium diazotrophicum TaxID=1261403 RepID=A0A419W595_9BACT|nr:GH92 family glycosyl hydrolase [Mangrovibacterium diazotrophicum]RKD90617.1 putative alpha-1,2-mannosidase [Mangrovibacterium diazotrophicum]